MTRTSFKFDVFLCHNDRDKPLIKEIYHILKTKDTNPFLDKKHLPPGHPWQEEIEDAIMEQVASCAVFVGPHGLGPVQRAEVQLALNRKFREPTFPVIPVLLPGCEPSNKNHVPPFLSLQTWVDFRNGIGAPDPLEKLVNAIHGKPISEISISEIETAIQKASIGLLTWTTTLGENQWLSRKELDKIIAIISNSSTSTLLLLGEPGSGKSALLAKLGQEMTSKGMPVLAVKADLLPVEINNFYELGNYLKLPFNPGECLVKLAEKGPVLLLLDQLDALADLVDLNSERLNVLLDLINSLSGLPNIHIVVSCREFEYSHDARLKSLKVEKIKLDLPSWEAVVEILKYKKIEAANWPESFRKLLRVPQHLKLFLEFCQGPEEPQIFSSYHAMLDRLWEERVLPLGEEGSTLLERIASSMAEREEFWLPTILFQENLGLIDRLIATGILVKEANGKRIGFCHQTILDYAKARAWARGKESLADFVIERQDALFVRPHLWTGLYYLRDTDPTIYRQEFERLWIFEGLRFHLKILMIEFLGQLPDPTDFEASWLLPYTKDHKLQGKIFQSIKGNTGWFNYIKSYLPFFMKQEDTTAQKLIPVLESAWDFAKEKILELLSNNWLSNPQKDHLSLQVFYSLKDWDEESVSMVCTILRRTDVRSEFVGHLAEAISASISELAPKIVRAHLDFRLDEVKAKPPPEPPEILEDADEIEKLVKQTLYDPHKYIKELIGSSNDWYHLSKIARANPKAFLDYLWPWFVEIWQLISKERHPFLTGYRDSNATELILPHDFNSLPPSNLMAAIEEALILLAENEPDEYLNFLRRWQDSDLHIVHRLLAKGLAKVANKYPDVALNYLLYDPRRLILGNTKDRHLDSKRLIAAVTPYLSPDQLKKLVNYIRNWPMYDYKAISDDDPETRFKRKKWEREHRLRLLKAIPKKYLDAEAKKFIEREERALPDFHDWDVQFSEVQRVVSPVSKEQMVKASDKHILKLFNKLDDSSGWDHPNGPLKDGTVQVSQEFGLLAKEDPERVIGLIYRMAPGKNEIAVGHGIQGLADSSYPSEKLFQLILKLEKRGFKKQDFRLSVANALRKRLKKEKSPLPDSLVNLLSSWLSSIPKINEPVNSKQLSQEKLDDSDTYSILWSHGGVEVLPSGNFPILEVLTLSFLYTDPIDTKSWLALLEEHLKRREDPAVWRSLLHYFRFFVHADHERAEKFLDNLFKQYPSVRDSFHGAVLIAYIQSWVNDNLIQKWLSEMKEGTWGKGPQAYSEILLLRHAWFPDLKWVKKEVDAILAGTIQRAKHLKQIRLGFAYCAAHLWPEPKFREMATNVLEILASESENSILRAIADTFNVAESLFPDEYTKRLLDMAIKNPKILITSNEYSLMNHFTKLVSLEPERVYQICNIFVNKLGKSVEDIFFSRHRDIYRKLTDIVLTLQRQTGPLRSKGLLLFERLLEFDVFYIRNVLVEIDRRPLSN